MFRRYMYINYRPLQCITLRLAVLAIFSLLLVMIVVFIVNENKTLPVTSDFHAGLDASSWRTMEKYCGSYSSIQQLKWKKDLTKSLCFILYIIDLSSSSTTRHIDESTKSN